MTEDAGGFYAAVGGDETFRLLVADFYARVATDPPLRELYPQHELDAAEERLRLFLMQYFGGPGTYSERRGHPRLRMRHHPFAVTPAQRGRWLTHMLAALDARALPPHLDAPMREYFARAADAMVNAEDG
ncbi:MAG: globin [Thermoleophilia bacterium]